MRLKFVATALGTIALCSSAAFADYIDLTTGGVGTFGSSGVYLDASPNLSNVTVGTGNIDSFVRLKETQPGEEGYNTSGRPVGFDENTSPQFTKDLEFGQLFSFNYEGNGVPAGTYYRFLLDINQTGEDPLLSLDSLKLYKSDTASIHEDFFPTPDMTLIWDMDLSGACSGVDASCTPIAGQDNGALLNYNLNNGSGNGIDMILWIPSALFTNMGAEPYLYLYSGFGFADTYENNSGFEEWARDANAPTDTSTPVSEPASLVLLGLGLAVLAVGNRFAIRSK